MRFVRGVAVVDEATFDEATVDEATMDDIVTVIVSLLLGEVEPDVRLNITLPAGTGNGAVLPRVLKSHALVDELPGPQQKDPPFWNGKIVMPELVPTRRSKCKISLVQMMTCMEGNTKGGEGTRNLLLFPTYHPDKTADIRRFAKMNLYRSPAKQLHCPSGRDTGHCPGKCRYMRSMGSPDQTIGHGRECPDWIPSRLGSNTFVRLSLLLPPGKRLRLR